MTSEPARLLGEYRLLQLVAEKPHIHRWYAEQTSVSRAVLVDELLDKDEPVLRNAFLADVRARAAVEHPLVASVYEAVSTEDACYFTHEYLPEPTLEEQLSACAALRPLDLAHAIRRVAEAQLYLESSGIATTPLELRNIHRDEHGLIRLDNTAIAGPRRPDQSSADATTLGSALLPLVENAQPGSTRACTLLSWMRGSEGRPPLTWGQIRDVALQIEHQLTQPLATTPAVATSAIQRRSSPWQTYALLGGLLLAAVAVLVFYQRANKPSKPQRVLATQPMATVYIPSGRYALMDGAQQHLPAFRIAVHEVTIAEYAEFLARLTMLAKDNQERIFDHPDQPPEKANHVPEDWEALWAAAQASGVWNRQVVTHDTAVVGIDWWDAYAYAEWRKARLPTQEEWMAALYHECPSPGTLAPSAWVPVQSAAIDRTPAGLRGMAGSVAEWTDRPSADPANPLGTRKWVLVGGSYLKPGSHGLTREWVENRSLRRPDLGFRLVLDAE
jgi:hypothetical protein